MSTTQTRVPGAFERAFAAPTAPESRAEIYHRLSVAMRTGDKARARRIYFNTMLPDKRFGNGEVARLAYRVGAIDEGDKYVAEREDL